MDSIEVSPLLQALITQSPESSSKRFENEDWTPLQLAASLGLPSTAQGLPADDTSVPKLSTLHIAAYRGHTHLIQANAEIIDLQDQFGFTPLHYAVLRRHKPIVEALLSLGALPSSESKVNFNVHPPDMI